MKTTNLFLTAAFLLMLVSCHNGDKPETDLITIDVTADYPEKELILQDIFDVEYVPLETTDEFITKGFVKAVSEHYILTWNRNTDGNLYLFDRATGKGIRVINRFGQSGEEYGIAVKCLIDEEREELYTFDAMARKTRVYDLEGNFKRSFDYAGEWYYDEHHDYDAQHLLCYVTDINTIPQTSCHLLISKQDGSIVREIQLPYEGEPVELIARQGKNMTMGTFYLTVPTADGWELINPSADTIYHCAKDGKLTPTIVRIPPIHTMSSTTFLAPTTVTNQYIFFHTMNTGSIKGFTHKFLVYDKEAKSTYEYRLTNSDLPEKSPVPIIFAQLQNYPLVVCQTLEAPDLVEAYQAGKLQGHLKEIAAKLDEEDNAVIMLVKYKEN